MLTNPVLISVIVMSILCLCKINILLSILISAMVAGITAGIPFKEIMPMLISGMGGNAEIALSYILLGALAYAFQRTGLATMLSNSIEKAIGKNAKILLFVIAFIACLSGTLIPVHIAFIPILIPPLLPVMNDMKLDRRAAACSLTFGLKAPYIALPIGYGLIFQGIIAEEMTKNGMAITKQEVWQPLLFPDLGMVLGLLLAIFVTYRKTREYKDIKPSIDNSNQGTFVTDRFTMQHLGAILGAVAAFVMQLFFGSLPLGALLGIIIMIVFKSIEFNKIDDTLMGGINLMGFVAFVMMVAAGYGHVIRETNGVPALVEATVGVLGTSKPLLAFIMLLLGLIITMGIGTSFGTIPIIATIYVPLCLKIGFSIPATVILIGVAGALGDAGSPASDSTLGPTAGLNADGQHDHIRDTCIPTFLHFNIPLIIFGVIGSLIF